MQDKLFIGQLERQYSEYLKREIAGLPFQPVVLRGGKERPQTYPQLQAAIALFQSCEKSGGKAGWNITWEDWKSKKLGNQQWPSTILVETEADFLFLLKKEREAGQFKTKLQKLLLWREEIRGWLSVRPGKVLELAKDWSGICAVVDYLIRNDVSNHYVRSLPVPVHTKFIERFSGTILSLIRHLDECRCVADTTDLERSLGLRLKPMLYPARWLDLALQERNLPGMEVFGISIQSLCEADWKVDEVWLVENETTLFMLPARPNAIAICSRGYAVEHLTDIPLLNNSCLLYWGDMDEDGYRMLSITRQKYRHVQSVLMEEGDFLFHKPPADSQPTPYRKDTPQCLTDSEKAAFSGLQQLNGRIEQEQLRLDYVMQRIQNAPSNISLSAK